MAERGAGGLRGRVFVAWVMALLGWAVLQSIVHLTVVLGEHNLHSVFDLDRSNGVPDVVSTVALAAAAGGAAALARYDTRTIVPAVLTGVLAAVTLADLLHEGAHPASSAGQTIVVLVGAAAALLVAVARRASCQARWTLLAAGCLLLASFLASGLDRFDQWFERRRGDPVAEYRIVAKEGLELVGWSLVALALWDEALVRRGSRPTAQAFRGPARRRRRGA